MWGLVNSIHLGLTEFGTRSKRTVEIMKSLNKIKADRRLLAATLRVAVNCTGKNNIINIRREFKKKRAENGALWNPLLGST